MPKVKKEFNFKIGADPEFILTMQGRKVDASQTMKLMLNKKKGFVPDKDGMGFDVDPWGNIGWDGASSTAEIRPKAANTPQEVTNNLGGIFNEFIKHIQICDMSTLSEFSSVGGHIHLEIPKGEKWTKEKANLIHRRLASFYLPVLISENKTNLNLRLKQRYGSLNDKRIEPRFKYPDGTPGCTLEFRCPSAEWLTLPKLANATMAYMAVVYHEILNHPKEFAKFNDIVYKSDKQGEALQTLAIMEYDILTNSILSKVKKYIRTFEMYPFYKDEIEYIFNPKQIIKDKQKANYNIAEGWKLITAKNSPKRTEILSPKKKVQEIASKKDFDIIKKVMNIHYNDDTNVALFAESLKDRVAAFNWKLKNNYFLFGMRKGIETIVSKNLKSEYLTGEEIIKTELDKAHLDNLFEKMQTKFNANMQRITTLDFSTGKIKDIRESVIVIGIPYTMRVKEDIKSFLSTIWELEKKEKFLKKYKKENILINDRDLPLERKGEIYRILTKQIATPHQDVVFDEGSVSLRNHESAIANMINEELSQNYN